VPSSLFRRLTPEQLLRQVEAEQQQESHRGQLKIFLGYASGVGKSFRMLDEGRRRKMRGQDVVVAATQSSCSPEEERLLGQLEVIPPRTDRGGRAIDVDAVLRRHPQVCLVDGLAYRNPEGSKNPERWQDVEELLDAGINVMTTINLQYIREKQKQVELIRGQAVKESVPEAFIRTADEIELVDADPQYCARRSMENHRSGDCLEVYSSQMERQLSELREIALVLAADVVDHQLEEYIQAQGIPQLFGAHERILVCITPRSNASMMIKRGRRQADRFHGELFVIYVQQGALSAKDQAILDANLEAAREADAHVEILDAEDAVPAILDFAYRHGITQIFVGHSQRSGLWNRLRANPVERLIMGADGIDIRIFPHE